jgi:DNA (cytosine-5)-methyltransferase 1
MSELSHLELFSGIGGFHRAFDLLGIDHNIEVPCVGYSEIDQQAIKTYQANYDVSSSVDLGDIVSFTENQETIGKLPDFKILTGGFPCQAFSMMGFKNGFQDERGNLFFNILKILIEKRPPFVLLENVRNLVTHDKKRTFAIIRESLVGIGYHIYFDIFNSNDFGLAQKRNRIFIFATRESLPSTFEFSQDKIKTVFDEFLKINTHSLEIQRDVLDVLDRTVNDKKYFLSERIKPTILSDGTGSYYSKSMINCLIARPLTATMVKLHRANQDNYYSLEFLQSKDPYAHAFLHQSTYNLLEKEIRRLTPKEALLLQGFSSDFYGNAIKKRVSELQLMKQAGNAVSVNTVYAILYYLFVYNGL